MMPVIETCGLTKAFGAETAIRDLSLQVERGEIFGFLGPNGAGKTTTLRLLLGFLMPTAGHAAVLGWDTWRQSVEVRRQVGYLPGDVRLYEHLTGCRFLQLANRVRGDPASPEGLARRLRLDLERRIKTYSKGMKQKLGLIQALMHEPPLLILDEPTAALDPFMQEELYAILRERRAAGATIFFSSHVLSEVEKICDRVGIVRAGQLIHLERVEFVRQLQMRRVEVTLGRGALPTEELRRLGVDPRPLGPRALRFTVRGEIDPVVKTLARCELEQLTIEPLTLEDVFFELYREGEQDGEASD